ncbi:MFS multidrug transporter [Lentithecium fluviatile CBS 122367]|uniref:MFS multidrug transporter n=1 Tax=Lentithecium fluviatile CBS 122367 TaxID=1168545 RepID=A0A6G1IQN2_9PLEO|nr:MFS multidrug transporter [Lentithecium fluviatile CBS 122367]
MAGASSSPILTVATAGDAQLEKGDDEPEISSCPADTVIVSWDGEVDPENPYNWSRTRKLFTTLLTSLGGFVTLMSGAMLAPALAIMSEDLRIPEAEASMVLSIYILAFAFGPMLLAPCSEVWGRRPIWIVGGAWYILWNTVCGASKTRGLIITGRLMAGLGASAEFAVSGPIVSDIWIADERGKSMAIRGFLPLLGPAIGPIVGGVMVQKANWRWLFFVMSILDGIIVLLFVLFLPETHCQTLLARKATRLRKLTGESYLAEHEAGALTLVNRLQLAFLRPVRMLLMQPAIQLCSLVIGVQFGLLYIALSTFSSLWTDRYKQTSIASGLHYLAIVTGYIIASLAGGWATDCIWTRLSAKNGGKTRPEFRAPMLTPGVVLVPVGLLWYGWAAENVFHWIVPDIGIAIFGCGYIVGTSAAQAFVVEAYSDYTASAGAASMLPRNVFAFAFPIFAPRLYASLGYGIGNTVLAAVAVVLGVPAPFILWKHGERLRRQGRVVG